MRRGAAGRGSLAVALLAAALSARAQEPEGLMGRPIESLAYTCDGPVDARQVASLVALSVGHALTEDDTGATIQNLFATGQFANVLVVASEAPSGGVAVTIHLWRSYRVGGISFEGRAHLSREEMWRALPLRDRGPFHAGALADGARALERKLATEGYIHARVEPEVNFDAATFTAAVVYRIDAGVPAVVAPPVFDGEIAPYTEETLTNRLRLTAGKPYRETKARAAADRLRKFLMKENRFRASVELIAAEPTEDGSAIRPVYRIDVGPAFEIDSAGIAPKRVRSEFLALLDAQSLDEDLIEQWVDTTREDLQRRGRYRATVEAKTDGRDPVTLRVAVREGPKYSVEAIEFSGNASVSDKTLRDLIVTRERGLPLIQSGYLIDGELEKDADAILAYYQTRGWIAAKVEKPAVTDDPKPDRLDVGFRIVEGPRTFVASRQVDGADHLSEADLDQLITTRVGEPFNPSAARLDAAALMTRYDNTGWREASVRDHWTLSPDKTKADVVFTVDEGMRTFFGKTIIRGNAVTEMSRITRQIAWKEGEPFSEEKIADTQRNLSRAGVFRSIEVRPQPADPENQEHTVDVDLTEARRISLLYGVGYQYAPGATDPNDPFATAGISYRNLFGRMQSASIEAQYAPISGRGYLVANFLEPYFFDTEYPLTVAAFASREPIQDVDVDRIGTFIESVRQFGHLRVGLRYSYQYIAPRNPEDLSTIVIEKYPLSAFPIRQSAIGPNFLYDRRDDVLDPHAGYYVSMAGGYAFPFLNADAWYGKVSGQAAHFWKIPGGVLGASFRAGAIYPHSVTTQGDTVPIAEKFFAGGSSTARGFDTNLEGIPGSTVDYNTQATYQPNGNGSCAQTYPGAPNANLYDCSPGPRIIGGNAFMSWGLEYRVPIAGNFGVSIFYDLAQVWATAADINFHIDTSDRAGIVPNAKSGLRQSIGLGIHYMTPIGPLRLEVGRPLPAQTVDFLVTRTVDPEGNPCTEGDPNRAGCQPLASGSVKQTGRIFLSIGYPF